MKNRINSKGFTLIEFGIVLTLFGLLIAGVIRGSELIGSAKVRSMIDQKSSIQMALLGFSNRYKSTAGDLTANQANFIAAAGSPNRALPSTAGGGDGIITIGTESILVFQNLAATNFLNCANCMTVTANGAAQNDNSPVNPFKLALQFGTVAPSTLGAFWLDPSALPAREILTTGAMVSSNLLRELDLKADDGAPHTGLFRQSTTGGASPTAICSPANAWDSANQANCAGAWLF